MKKQIISLNEYKNHWALITGASSGIGYELARAFAKAGMNLVLVARNQDKLTQVSDELKRDFEIQTLILDIDLSQPNAANLTKQLTEKHSVKVRILCNNAAFGYWGHFEKAESSTYDEMIQVNVNSAIDLCRVFHEHLASFASAIILNICSTAVLQPVPYMSVYAASKACLYSFSLALYGEWMESNIIVQALMPGPTATEFDKKAGLSGHIDVGEYQSASEVASIAMQYLGDYRRPVIYTSKAAIKQRLLCTIVPIRTLLAAVTKMFKPR